MSLFHKDDAPSFYWDDFKAWVKRRFDICTFCGCKAERIDPRTNFVPNPSLPPWNVDDYRWWRCTSCGLVDREERCGGLARWAFRHQRQRGILSQLIAPHWFRDVE